MDIICETFLKFTSLWFDWLKWLIITGAITLIADKTKEIAVLYVMYSTYIILTIYMIILMIKMLNFIVLKLSSLDRERWEGKTNGWIRRERPPHTYFTFILAIIQLITYITSGLISTSIVYYWYELMHNIVLKFQLS
jgi:hypothetical protein